MLRRPPRSTLFPTRRSSDLCSSWRGARRLRWSKTRKPRRNAAASLTTWGRNSNGATSSPRLGSRDELVRSEEHTSELQSHSDLVCRLLLEKKKKNKEIRTQR